MEETASYLCMLLISASLQRDVSVRATPALPTLARMQRGRGWSLQQVAKRFEDNGLFLHLTMTSCELQVAYWHEIRLTRSRYDIVGKRSERGMVSFSLAPLGKDTSSTASTWLANQSDMD
jgi:hypothetical protein